MAVSNTPIGIKYDQDKPRVDLIPSECLVALAQVYTMGAKKYTDHNWRNGMEWGRVYAAIFRHMLEFWMGKDKDEESGLNPIIHAAWGCFTLYWYWLHKKGIDNRWKSIKKEEPNG